MRSSHCPNLVKIGYNANFLSRFQVMGQQYGIKIDPMKIGYGDHEF